jgi:hypothetical protein
MRRRDIIGRDVRIRRAIGQRRIRQVATLGSVSVALRIGDCRCELLALRLAVDNGVVVVRLPLVLGDERLFRLASRWKMPPAVQAVVFGLVDVVLGIAVIRAA